MMGWWMSDLREIRAFPSLMRRYTQSERPKIVQLTNFKEEETQF
jgi:hypothetical protein